MTPRLMMMLMRCCLRWLSCMMPNTVLPQLRFRVGKVLFGVRACPSYPPNRWWSVTVQSVCIFIIYFCLMISCPRMQLQSCKPWSGFVMAQSSSTVSVSSVCQHRPHFYCGFTSFWCLFPPASLQGPVLLFRAWFCTLRAKVISSQGETTHFAPKVWR